MLSALRQDNDACLFSNGYGYGLSGVGCLVKIVELIFFF